MTDQDRTRPGPLEELRALRARLERAEERCRRAEEALRESEDAYRALAETTTDGLVTVDEAGTVLSANGAAEAVFGFGPGELVGQDVAALIPEVPRDALAAGSARPAAAGQGARCPSSQVTVTHRSGRP